MGASVLAQVAQEESNAKNPEHLEIRLLRIAFWLVAGATGFLQIWLEDRVIWADTLSYLDSGDLLWQGDFANAITNHWSPGLPFLLGLAMKVLHPVGLWEVAVVKLVDLVIFIFAIAGFDYFISQFCRYHETSTASEYLQPMVPELALRTVGYLLFIWTIIWLLPAWYSTPDMLVMGLIFLIFALLLKIRMGATGLLTFALLGVVLGCGYLVKAPLFLLAFMFLGIAFLLVEDRRKAIPRVALSFLLFALIATPLVLKLSALAGSPTFGKSGAWNYARTVNGIAVAYHWQGKPPGSGTPQHPTRVIFQSPTIYEFGSPVRGTFPPWRDPYYWFAGITPHFDLVGQWRVIKANAKTLEHQAGELNQVFFYGFLVLLCMSSDMRLIGRIIGRQWFLLFPAIATLAMFSVVLVEDRYIAPYPIVVGLVLFSSVAVVRSASSPKLVQVTVLLAAALFAASSISAAAAQVHSFSKSLRKGDILGLQGPWDLATQAVSDALKAHGLQRGDRVAYIGETNDFYWARLAGLQVNAEIRQWELGSSFYALVPRTSVTGLEHSVDKYWASPPELKEKVDGILRQTGSKAIVTDTLPTGAPTNGWDQVPGTSFYVHMLPDHTDGNGHSQ